MENTRIKKINNEIKAKENKISLRRTRQDELQMQINRVLVKNQITINEIEKLSEKERDIVMSKTEEFEKLQNEIFELFREITEKKELLKMEEAKLQKMKRNIEKKDAYNRHRKLGQLIEENVDYEFLDEEDLSILKDFFNNASVKKMLLEKLEIAKKMREKK